MDRKTESGAGPRTGAPAARFLRGGVEYCDRNAKALRHFCVLALCSCTIATLSAENWPQWRGPSLNGLSAEKNLPVRWSKTENITWKLPLPAWSGSTPIVWGDRIFLNVAEDLRQRDGDNLFL